MLEKCVTCGRPLIEGKIHKCPPKFKVWDIDNYGEKDAEDIYEIDAEEAAEKYVDALAYESADFESIWRIMVKAEDGKIHRFEVTPEHAVNWYVREVDENRWKKK